MEPNRTLRSALLPTALGMIFAELAVSPLYVFRFILSESGGAQALGAERLLGSLSLILWTLLLPATVKGVLLLLRADNHGEGGQFALYMLVREHGRGLLFPAALGAAALLVGAALTPVLTLSAVVEGGRSLFPNAFPAPGTRALVIMAVLLLSLLFFSQGFDSRRTERLLDPLTLLWLLFIGAAGAVQLPGARAALRAFDPRLGLRLLFAAKDPTGFSLLGLVFLSVAGTQLLYADLDLVGRRAVTRAWPFVLLCLGLSYLGQGAWLLRRLGEPAGIAPAADPFFQMLPAGVRPAALPLAFAAAWSASRVAVKTAFARVSEAIRLELLPALEIRWPSDALRQEWIPAVNFLMWFFGCAAAAVFQSAQRTASVYGLSAALAALTQSVLLFVYARTGRALARPTRWLILPLGVLEACCLIACLVKLSTGGVLILLLILLLTAAMLAWNRAGEIERKYGARLPLRDWLARLEELRGDTDFVQLADNLVYIDKGKDLETVDQGILYSVLDRGPKRARAYFFVTVNTVGEPFLQRCRAESFGTDCVFRLCLDLGYKCSRPLTHYLREALSELERQGLAPMRRRGYGLSEASSAGTFRYFVLHKRAAGSEALSLSELWALRMRDLLQGLAGLREEWYTEEDTDVEVERIPLSFDAGSRRIRMQRLFDDDTDASH